MISDEDKVDRDDWFEFLGWNPHRGQRKIIELYDNSQNTVLICARRFGKSDLATKLAEVELLKPNKNIGIVAPTYDNCRKLMRLLYHDMVIKGGAIPSEGTEKSSYLAFPWGSSVELISADNITSRTNTAGLGSEFDLVILEESAHLLEDAWELNVSPTLATRRGKSIHITTPLGMFN